MALDGIMASVSALRVTERRVSQTAHNLANLSTPGFTPGRVEQADLAQGGVAVIGASSLAAGPILTSESQQGGNLYTRAGNFTVNAQGQLTDAQGHAVIPGITLPAQTAQVNISSDGLVQALSSDGQVLAQGQLQTDRLLRQPRRSPSRGRQRLPGNRRLRAPGQRRARHRRPRAHRLRGLAGLGHGHRHRDGQPLTIDQRVFEANLKALRTQDETLGFILDVVG